MSMAVARWLSGIATEYRLDKQLESALAGAMNRAEKELVGTGAEGVLFVARYERDKNADLYKDQAPPDITKRLVGDRLEFVQVGTSPKNALAMSFNQRSLKRNSQKGTQVLPATKAFWITSEADGSLKVAELEYSPLAREARQIFIDEKVFARLNQSERRMALGDSLDALERQTNKEDVRSAARDLILAREAAIAKLAEKDIHSPPPR